MYSDGENISLGAFWTGFLVLTLFFFLIKSYGGESISREGWNSIEITGSR